MAISDHDMTEAWKTVLSLSRLEHGQMVTILTGPHTHPQTLATAKLAVQSMGATVNCLDLQPVNGEKAISRDLLAYVGITPLAGNAPAMAACKASHLVLDLMLLLFSPEQAEILESGTKILLAVEPPEILCRILPKQEDKVRITAAARMIEAASMMTVTSPAGTDLRCPLGQYPVVMEYGFVDEPGRWDHWPSGFALTWANEGAAEGQIVLERGDILLPTKSYVRDRITLTIEKGYATSITGGLDAELLNDYMESFADPEGYAMSHIGWGSQPLARWSALEMYDREKTIAMDARAFAGNFLFSLGPNTEVGGTRNTPCHIDVPMRGCTVKLDGLAVVVDGHLVEGVSA
jgi:2,5-dihydroxypyridine 5,6-dioxygenase